jgi:hypothetical protein
MHSERNAIPVLARVALRTGVSRRRRRRASSAEGVVDEEREEGDSVFPRREMTKKTKWVVHRNWTDKFARVRRCNPF